MTTLKVEKYHFIWGVVIGTAASLALLSFPFWSDLPSYDFDWKQSLVDFRNVALIVGGCVGLWFANRRLKVMEAQETHTKTKLDNEEKDKADKDFIEALKMFGDKESQPSRFAGLLSLEQYCKDNPEHYLKIFCILRAFVEEVPTEVTNTEEPISRKNYEILTIEILKIIGKLRLEKQFLDIEKNAHFNTDFQSISILGEYFMEADENITFKISGGNFSDLKFHNANLKGLLFYKANVKGLSVSQSIEKEMAFAEDKIRGEYDTTLKVYDYEPKFKNC